MKMIEIWLKITFIFINGHDFQSGIKSVCDECKNNGFFSLSKQCVLPHMPTVIPLFTCVNIDCTSKMGGANFSTLTLFWGYI
jgi:hypothetical protein